ncbi:MULTISPECIES: hypothetical protein [unclassified Novosphingobium]|uniref:hypothetical protein n=1 Tax=unclassified Novosphingobium TaxID=2644732 RepID=UPI00135A58E7|nr:MULTISPECIES: hypothetical protein [unclassified Novosphingobium]
MSSLLTPRFLVNAARLALLPCLGGLAAVILGFDASPASAAATTFLAAIVMLQAAPKVRAADMLGILALLVTMLEWVHAGMTGSIDATRWQAVIAVAGAMALLLKIQHLRSLAREDPYVPLRHLERRSALLSRPRPRKDETPAPPTRRAA